MVKFKPDWVVCNSRPRRADGCLKGVTEFPDGSNFTVKANWLASATGRIGYSWYPWLLYATGGVAWVRDNYEITGDSSNFTAGDTRTGWTVGVGLEYVFWAIGQRIWNTDTTISVAKTWCLLIHSAA